MRQPAHIHSHSWQLVLLVSLWQWSSDRFNVLHQQGNYLQISHISQEKTGSLRKSTLSNHLSSCSAFRRSQNKNYIQTKANIALFFPSSWSISTFVCLLIYLLPSNDEYVKEISVLSVISLHRQFWQLNQDLISVTKEHQEDKGTWVLFSGAPCTAMPTCQRNQCQALIVLADM